MSTSGIDSAAVSTQLESIQSSVPKDISINDLIPDPAPQDGAQVGVSLKEVYKSLTVLGQKVLDRLQEILGNQLPDGLDSLKPEDHTPEKTAQNIVDGTTALFGIYQKQHPELQGEELISNFMKTIRGGIDKGYSEAEGTLKDIGAFDIDGVQSGIDQTKKLVEQKLQAFEDNYRKQNGLAVNSDAGSSDTSSSQAAKLAADANSPAGVNQVA